MPDPAADPPAPAPADASAANAYRFFPGADVAGLSEGVVTHPAGPSDADQIAGAQAAVSASLARAATGNADQAARDQAIALGIGVSPDVVGRQREAATQAAAQRDADQRALAAKYPELAQYLQPPPIAAVAHDDLDALTALHSTMDHLTALSQQATQGHLLRPADSDVTGLLPAGYQFLRDGTVIRPVGDGTQAIPFATAADAQRDAAHRGDQAALAGFARMEAYRATVDSLGLGETGAALVAPVARAVEAALPGAHADAEASLANLPGAGSVLGDTIPRMVGGFVGQVPALALGELTTGGVANVLMQGSRLARMGDLMDAGVPLAALPERVATATRLSEGAARLSPYAAQQIRVAAAMAPANAAGAVADTDEHGSIAHAAIDGLLNEAIVGFMPAGALGRTLIEAAPGGTLAARIAAPGGFRAWDAARDIAVSMGWQGGQGAAQALAGALNDRVTLGRPIDVGATLGAMAQQGAFGATLGGVFGGMEAIPSLIAHRMLGASAAVQFGDALNLATDQLGASKLAGRSESVMGGFLRRMNQDGLSTVTLDAEAWRDHWNAQSIDPHAIAAAAGVGDAYRQALATGGAITMPLDRYLLAAMRSQDPRGLNLHARGHEDGMSAAEGAAHLTQTEQQARERKQQAVDLAREMTGDGGGDATDAIHDHLLHSLAAAMPQVPAETLDALATHAATVFGTLGKATTRDPMEVYRQYAPIITNPDVQRAVMAGDHDAVRTAIATAGERAKADALANTAAQPHLEQPPLLLPSGDFAAHGGRALRRQWRKAHGGQAPAMSDAQWRRMVEESVARDRETVARNPDAPAAHSVYFQADPAHPAPETERPSHFHGGSDPFHVEQSDARLVTARLGPERIESELAETHRAISGTSVREAANVPYGMGMSRDGRVAYRDPQFPTTATSIHGKPIDALRATLVHEVTEHRWMEGGHSYHEAHAVANAVERAELARQGLSEREIDAYERSIQPTLRRTRDWTGEPPSDLDPRPYEEEDETSLLMPPDERTATQEREQAASHLSDAAQMYIRSLPVDAREEIGGAIRTAASQGDRAQDIAIVRAAGQATFHQGAENAAAPRGWLTFPSATNRTFRMALTSAADVSTFIHEMTHLYVEVIGDLAQQDGTAQWLKDDYQHLMEWSGYGSHQGKIQAQVEEEGIYAVAAQEQRELTPEEQTAVAHLHEPHERIARAMEQYMLEGRAPTDALRTTFARIKGWMKAVYKGLLNLNVIMTPGVREVFDRLLGAGDAVDRAASEQDSSFQTAAQAGMSEEEFADYRQRIDQERQRAEERVSAESIAEYRRSLSQAVRQERARVTQEVTRALGADPVYTAIDRIRAEPGLRLNRAELVGRYGDDVRRAMPGYGSPRNRGMPLTAKDGIPIDDAASQLGFPSGDAMIRALTQQQDRGQAIARLVDAEMDRRYGSLLRESDVMGRAHAALYGEGAAEREDAEAQRLQRLASKRADPQAIARAEMRRSAERQLEALQERTERAAQQSQASREQTVQQVRAAMRAAIHDNPALLDARLADDDRTPAALHNAADRKAAEAVKLAALDKDNADRQSAAGALRESLILHAMAERRAAHELATARDAPRDAERRLRAEARVLDPEMRAAARAVVQGMAIRDLNPRKHDRAAKTMASKVAAALVKGDYEGAYNAKLRQLMAMHLAHESRAAMSRLHTVYDVARSLASDGDLRARIGLAGVHARYQVDIPGIGTRLVQGEDAARDLAAQHPGAVLARRGGANGYLDQIDALLDRYEFSPASNAAVARRVSLRQFLDEQAEKGMPVAVPQSVIDQAQRMHWREATVQQITDVGDALRNLRHCALAEYKTYADGKRADIEQIAGALTTRLQENVRASAIRHGEGLTTPIAGALDGLNASLMMVRTYIERADGDIGGDWFEHWSMPLAHADDRLAVMAQTSAQHLHGIIDDWGKAGDARHPLANAELHRMRTIDGVGEVSHLTAIMVALNWGSDGNRQRLLDGHRWTPEQVHKVLDTLDADDHRFVHNLWGWLSEPWEQVKGLEERVHGIAPEKVAPAPFQTRVGHWDGGYCPITYDSSQRANPRSADASTDQTPARFAAMTTHGHVERRTASQGRPLVLSIDALTRHMNDVHRDLAFRETLIDHNRLLKALQPAIEGHLGPQAYRQFQRQLVACAGGDDRLGPFDRVVDGLRQGLNAARRAFNLAPLFMMPGQLAALGADAGWVHTFLAAPAAFNPARWAEAEGKSTVMRFRNAERIKDLHAAMTTLSRLGPLSHAQALAYLTANLAWKGLDNHAWHAFYNKAIAAGHDEAMAVRIADDGMVSTQGATANTDRADLLRKGGIWKLVTNNMGWANAQWNQMAGDWWRFADTAGIRPDSQRYWALGSAVLSRLIIAPMVYEAWKAGMAAVAGGDPDKDHRWSDPLAMAKNVARQMAGSVMAGIPFARDLAPALDGKTINNSGTPAPGAPFANLLVGDGKHPSADRMSRTHQALLDAAGSVLHLPSTAIEHAVNGYLWASHHHAGAPTTAGAMLLGPPTAR